MIESPWQGALWMARDFCLLDGVAGSARPHAHYAHQALLAKATPLRLTLEEEPCGGRFLLVESMRAHAIEDSSQDVVAVYAEPLAFSPATLRQMLADAPADLEALAGLLLAAPRQRLDLRIAKALATVDALLEEKVSAAALAKRACLSLSQLERLFSDQVGLSVRRLVLWRRMHGDGPTGIIGQEGEAVPAGYEAWGSAPVDPKYALEFSPETRALQTKLRRPR